MKHIFIKNKKAILFDSGKVLNAPTTGNWFITPNFFKYISKEQLQELSQEKIYNAFSKAYKYIESQPLISDREEEYIHFKEYFKIMFENLEELNVSIDTLECIAHDYVYSVDKYTFFEDAKAIIPKLYANYQLAIVSDAWPSLENIYIEAHLREYFSSFIISSQIGVIKPHPLMYQKALHELGVQPSETIFIDDNINNCEGAIKLGIDAILLCRDKDSYLTHKETNKINVILGLNELEEILLVK
ncbi:MAG: HAD family hydrolase [Cellulosilyticaceae bacterium]